MVVLKARQLGVSWLAAIYALWFAMRKPGQVVLIISQREDDAVKFLEKVSFIWERLPEWRTGAKVNVKSIELANGSSLEAMPATANIGRSRTANLVILDEHAYQGFARKILLALKPVAEKGQILSISSGNGQGALHSQLYISAKAGINGLTKALAKEWGRYKVNVNSVAFGLIMTRLTEVDASADAKIDIAGQQIKVGVRPDILKNAEATIPLGRGGTPEEAAGAVYLFCIPESDYVSGQVLVCGGGKP